MVGACLTIAEKAENKAVWDGKAPLDFASDLAALRASYNHALAKAAAADAANHGAGDAKAVAETALENAAYVLTRALTAHYRKVGDAGRLTQVDLSHSDIARLRNQELLAKTTELRDFAVAVKDAPGAADRGITPERIAALTAAISAFAAVVNFPREKVVSRGTLLKELGTDVADLMVQLAGLDDLVLQFGGTPEGEHFQEEWRRARIVIDRGGSTASATPPPAPAAPVTVPAK